MAASVLGRQFGLPLLEAVAGRTAGPSARSRELMRLDLIREGRRWPEPEYRFKHALIQEAAYRTLVADDAHAPAPPGRRSGSRRSAGREDEVAGLLAHHWLGAEDEDKAIRVPDRGRRPRAPGVRARRGDRPLPGAAAAPRAPRRAAGDRARAVQARARAAHVAALRGGERGLPAGVRSTGRRPRRAGRADRDAADRVELPAERPRSPVRDRVAEHPALHAAVRPARRAVAGADDRARRSPSDGRSPTTGCATCSTCARGSTWSDGVPAHRARRRVRDQAGPRPRRARAPRSRSTSCSSRDRSTTCARTTTPASIGVRALDDRTVEFRLAAPAPYFMSVMNRPDGGPQPRHAIEPSGDAWTEAGAQVVSGAFRIARARRRPPGARAPRRRRGAPAAGNVARVEIVRSHGRRGGRAVRATTSSTWSRCATRRGSPTWCRRARRTERGRAGRRGPATSRSTTRTRSLAEPRPAPRARARGRSRGAGRESCRRTWWSRPAASCRPRSRATRRTSRSGSTPTSRASTWRAPGPSGAARGGRRSRTTCVADRAGRWPPWREVLGLDGRASGPGRWESSRRCRRPRDARAHLLHRLAPRLRRPRVLPAAAVPVGQPDERGRVLLRRRSTS